jgi:hypothetical protein
MEDFMQPLKSTCEIEKHFIEKYWGFFLIIRSPNMGENEECRRLPKNKKLKPFLFKHVWIIFTNTRAT